MSIDNVIWRRLQPWVRTFRHGSLSILALLVIDASHAAGAEPLVAGPLFSEFPLTLAPGNRLEIAGPLHYQQESGPEKIWALPPLFSRTSNPDLELVEVDFAYPIMTYDRYGDQYRWQFFQLLSFAGGPTQTETNRHRFTIFPIYFQQRSSDPAENYTAYGPFYGHLKKRLMRDEIFYVMFPGYSQTRKKDTVTDNYLYPFFHLRHGPGLNGWQFWPLVGNEHKEVTTRTNMFNEPEIVPGHDRFFALWPLFYNAHTDVGTENPMWQQGVLPFYALQRSPNRDSTTVVWPFLTRIDEREKKYREWQAPWPVVDFARGEGKTISRVWPFYSHAHSAYLQSDFVLWPIYKYNRTHSAPLDRERWRILFYLYSDIAEHNTETKQVRRRTDLWPLYVRQVDFNGNRRVQLVAPLEIFVAGSHKIERDWSPVWSVWRAERNAKSGAASQSLLWNLYRRESAPDHKKLSLLFGLFQYQSSPEGRQTRLFYVPLSKSRGQQGTPASEPSEPKGERSPGNP